MLNSKHGDSTRREILPTAGSIIAVLLVMVFMLTFVLRSYEVSGISMQQTLHDKDRMIIWKLPRALARITGHDYIPNRGDIVVVAMTDLSARNQSGSKQIVKRVIGLPGDRVVVSNGDYTVYNRTHPDGFNPDKTLAYGKSIPSTPGATDITLGETQLFVSGDNRSQSCDSRAFGSVNAKQIVGKLVVRTLPINKTKIF